MGEKNLLHDSTYKSESREQDKGHADHMNGHIHTIMVVGAVL